MKLYDEKTHSVFTAVSLFGKFGSHVTELFSFVNETKVHFVSHASRTTFLNDVKAYVEDGEGSDKAGGYAVQGKGGPIVRLFSPVGFSS